MDEYRSVIIILLYCFTSSSLLLINKFCVTVFPFPCTLTLVQGVFIVMAMEFANHAGWLKYDKLSYPKVKVFSLYALLFAVSLVLNNRALTGSNVETVIVFRASTPLVVSMLDWFFLGRKFPSFVNLISLFGLTVAVAGYVLTDAQFAMEGLAAFFWVFLYMLSVCVVACYGKYIIDSTKFESPIWGSVFYCNSVSIPFVIGLGFMDNDYPTAVFAFLQLSISGLLLLLVSNVLAMMIGYYTWECRTMLSATAFTLVGVLCKVATIIVNMLVWNKHTNASGLFCLFVGLVSASFYTQAPMRVTEELVKESEEIPLRVGDEIDAENPVTK